MSSPSAILSTAPTALKCAPSAAPTMAGAVDSSSFISTVATNFIIGTILVMIFSFIRTKTDWCHRFRLHQKEHLNDKVPKIADNSFSFEWIRIVWSMTDEDLIKSEIGVDAIMYLRFLRLSFRYFGYTLPIAVFYMFLYKYADPQDDEVLPEMDELTIANVKSGSPLLWVYCLGSFSLTGLLCHMLFKEYETYVSIRHKMFLTDTSDADVIRARKTALVQNIPKEAQDETAFAKLFQTLYPGLIYESSTLCYDTRKVDDLLTEREGWFRKWERAEYEVAHSEDGQRPLVRAFPLCGRKVDAVDYFSGKIDELNIRINEIRRQGMNTTTNGFVTFKTFDAIATATQIKQTMKPFVHKCRLAMLPTEANWRNLVMTPLEFKLRKLIGGVIVFFLVIFWTIPVAFASSLTNLQSLESVVPGLDWVLDNMPALASFLSGFLPGLALIVFKAMLPKILLAISTFKGFEAQQWIERDTFRSFFYFQLFNFYLIAALGGAVIGSIGSILGSSDDKDPCASTEDEVDFTDLQQVADLLATKLPAQWMTFLSYIALQALTAFPILLADLGPYILGSMKLKYLAKTSYERIEAIKPLFMKYHVDYPNQLLVFMIGCAFAPLAPILIIFIALYFAIASVVYTYRLVYVTPKKYDGGGSLFPLVFNRIIVGMIVGQVTLMGVLALKMFAPAVVLMIIQIILTIMFKNYTSNAFEELSDNLTRQEIVELDSFDTRNKEDFVSLYLSPGIKEENVSLVRNEDTKPHEVFEGVVEDS